MAVRPVKALRRAFAAMVRGPYVTLVGMATIFVAVFAVGLFAVALSGAERLLAVWAGEVRISVYLSPGADLLKARNAASAIAVGRRVEAVPAAVALRRLSDSLGDEAHLLEGVEPGVLPDAVEVDVPGIELRSARDLANRLRQVPGAVDVDYGNGWLERLETIVKRARLAGIVLFVALALATSVLVSNTLRLAVYARQDEIEIMKLVGATDGFVSTPFLIEGALQGFFGAGLAVLSLLLAGTVVLNRLKEALPVAAGLTLKDTLPPGLGLVLLAAGTGVGLLASALSVKRALRRT